MIIHTWRKPGQYIDIIVAPRYNFIIVVVFIALFIITKYSLNQITAGTEVIFNSH